MSLPAEDLSLATQVHPIGRRRPAWLVTASAVFLLLVLVTAVASPLLLDAATRQSILDSLLPPGSDGHLLGTDELGRDVLLLTIAGTGSAIIGPLAIALGSMLLAIVFGTMAGYLRGPVDWVIGRLVDTLLSLPVMLVAIVVAGIFGAGYWVEKYPVLPLFPLVLIFVAGAAYQLSRPPPRRLEEET